jgi:hypothetical protein
MNAIHRGSFELYFFSSHKLPPPPKIYTVVAVRMLFGLVILRAATGENIFVTPWKHTLTYGGQKTPLVKRIHKHFALPSAISFTGGKLLTGLFSGSGEKRRYCGTLVIVK